MNILASSLINLLFNHQVCFTGSTATGREIMKAAAMSNLKPVSLELGGKSPLIIFDDVDVEMASSLALQGILFNKVHFISKLEYS